MARGVRKSLQELTRLLAQYRRRLDRGDDLHPAELLRALIAEIENPCDRKPPKDMRAGRGC
jgi:hypothetical protein